MKHTATQMQVAETFKTKNHENTKDETEQLIKQPKCSVTLF